MNSIFLVSGGYPHRWDLFSTFEVKWRARMCFYYFSIGVSQVNLIEIINKPLQFILLWSFLSLHELIQSTVCLTPLHLPISSVLYPASISILFSLKHKWHGPQQITLFSQDLALAFFFLSLSWKFCWGHGGCGGKTNWSSSVLSKDLCKEIYIDIHSSLGLEASNSNFPYRSPG